MEILFLVCLIGFAAGAAIDPKAEVDSEAELPGIYGISDEETICIGNYLNGKVLDSECKGSINNVLERLKWRFGEFSYQFHCVRRILNDYKYKDVYLLYEYNAKTHGKTRELSEIAQAAVNGLSVFCNDTGETVINHIEYRFYALEELDLKEAQCAYRFAIEKDLLKQSDYNINPKDFASVDCKSYYEDWRSKTEKRYEVNISDETQLSEFEKCVHKMPSLINHELELFVLQAVGRLTHYETVMWNYQDAFDKAKNLKERYGLECIREMASKVIARNS